ncbi:MAG: mercuric reductase [Candidatus Tectimicrobiota bacterium]|nr:MAG: mercuric reductase [Candidatus Tectomicrobia bacterium]
MLDARHVAAFGLLPEDEDDARLLQQVHPPGWQPPAPRNPYNLVVLGGGTAGLVAAAGAAALGARVALVEKHLLGGDCLNTGCVPSKALLRSAAAVAAVRDAARFGVRLAGEARVDFAAVMARLRRLRADLSAHDAASRFAALGVDVFLGHGRFTGPRQLQVAGMVLTFARALIATGSRPAVPPISGLREAGYLTNETVFGLTACPRRLGIIGGGPIGCELAQAFQRLGAQVTLLHRGAHLLSREDPEAAAVVQQALRRDGVILALPVTVLAVARREADRVIHYQDARGQRHEATVDAILVATGRRPVVQDLGLEAAGVAYDLERGVHVDECLRTSNRRIFAAGDVCSAYKFTHAADFLARTVLANALFPGRRKASALTIPWCTYTDPQLARVGLSAAQATAAGVAIDTYVQPLAEVDRAVLDGESEGFVKVHVKRGTDRIVGATIVAPHAGELIGLYTLALSRGLGLKALGACIQPYPTLAEAVRKTADLYQRTRLTPRVQQLMGWWLRWQRRGWAG